MLMLLLAERFAGSAAPVPAWRGGGVCGACAGFTAGEISCWRGAVGAASATIGAFATLCATACDDPCGTAVSGPILPAVGRLNEIHTIPLTSRKTSRAPALPTHCRVATLVGTRPAIQSPIDIERSC